MINSILQVILSAFLKIITFILNIVLAPLTLLLNGLFPGLDDFVYYFDNLFNNNLAHGLEFAREVFFNYTGINRELFGILALIPLTYFGFTMANMAIRFLMSIFILWKQGEMK